MLMSNLVLTVADGLPCEIEPFQTGAAAWLEGGSSSSTSSAIAEPGVFEDCHLLRVRRGRQEELLALPFLNIR